MGTPFDGVAGVPPVRASSGVHRGAALTERWSTSYLVNTVRPGGLVTTEAALDDLQQKALVRAHRGVQRRGE